MKLDLYFASRFLKAFLQISGIFSGLILMIEYIEQLRSFAGRGLDLQDYIIMTLLRWPVVIYEILPLIVVIAAIVMYLSLARSSELVITRASGRSALRTLCAPIMMTFILGVIVIGILNPMSVTSDKIYEANKSEFKHGTRNVFSISDNGLWLREGHEYGHTLTRANRINESGSILYDVTLLQFAADGFPNFRIQAASALIKDQNWHLNDVKRWPLGESKNPEAQALKQDFLTIATDLTPDDIKERFQSSNANTIWNIPEQIKKLEAAGFSTLALKMSFHEELSLPLTFIAMMIIGASFTMKHARLGGTPSAVLAAILTAFSFFFLRRFTLILGQNGEIPIIIAAWAAPLAIIFILLALLLHLEDG